MADNNINNSNEVRDAVIKLEAKMELMSESMMSLADSVSKLADIRYELVGMKKDIAILHQASEKSASDIHAALERVRVLENTSSKTTYVIGKIEILWGAIVTCAVSFLYLLLNKG